MRDAPPTPLVAGSTAFADYPLARQGVAPRGRTPPRGGGPGRTRTGVAAHADAAARHPPPARPGARPRARCPRSLFRSCGGPMAGLSGASTPSFARWFPGTASGFWPPARRGVSASEGPRRTGGSCEPAFRPKRPRRDLAFAGMGPAHVQERAPLKGHGEGRRSPRTSPRSIRGARGHARSTSPRGNRAASRRGRRARGAGSFPGPRTPEASKACSPGDADSARDARRMGAWPTPTSSALDHPAGMTEPLLDRLLGGGLTAARRFTTSRRGSRSRARSPSRPEPRTPPRPPDRVAGHDPAGFPTEPGTEPPRAMFDGYGEPPWPQWLPRGASSPPPLVATPSRSRAVATWNASKR